jgi:hypothetical protein
MEIGAAGGERNPIIGPFWFTPGYLKRRANGSTFGVDTEGDDAIDVSGVSVDSLGSSGSSLTGAMPHRPKTQPPTRRPSVVALRGPVVAVEVVLVLSADAMDAASDLLPAAMEASKD